MLGETGVQSSKGPVWQTSQPQSLTPYAQAPMTKTQDGHIEGNESTVRQDMMDDESMGGGEMMIKRQRRSKSDGRTSQGVFVGVD